ncbi:replication associated protein [Varroa mite associated virus 1]|uniref:replication associated protein n=1 Tax=Varroa mite associated virus 1 TaxID=2077300 RepID=UPI000CD34665|nr:replication associated protein [Varroa mite associated virus 1]AUT11887.1 replication associated protein [Varroa mite associated virus 1]
MSRSKNWQFTINNHGAVDPLLCQWRRLLEQGKINYLVCQCERGDNGTPHIQGMLQCKNAISMQSAKDRASSNAHVEVAIRPKELRAYCMKEDTRELGPWEIGEFRNEQGKRTDLDLARQAIDDGATDAMLAKEHFSTFVKYHKGLSAARMHIQRPTNHYIPKKVVLFHGMPGTGKTYFCLVTLGLDPASVYVKDTRTKWWDGYAGQKVVVMDEFPGSLSALDWKLYLGEAMVALESKGGTMYSQYETVYLTSNYAKEELFPNARDIDRQAVQRRISESYEIRDREVDFLPFLENYVRP